MLKIFHIKVVLLLVIYLFQDYCFCQTIIPTSLIDGPSEDVTSLVQIKDTTNNIQDLSDNIPVSLVVTPLIQKYGITYVSTGVNLTVIAVVTNPTLANISLLYHWSTKSGIISADLKASKIEYTFTQAEPSSFIKVDVVPVNTTAYNLTGEAQINLNVVDPVSISEPAGKLFLEHGELLDIKLQYKGTPPFDYCYKFCGRTDILPCSVSFLSLTCLSNHVTDKNEIAISHYLHSVGSYILYFRISNLMNEQTKEYTIKINDIVRHHNLPYAPIISSILAVIILLSGLALHLHFRKTAYTETANFDFIRQSLEEEEWKEEQSFIERVRYLFCRGEDETIEEERHMLPGARFRYESTRVSNQSQN